MDGVPTLRSVGLTCGILGIIQSTIWLIASTLDLLVYNCIIPIELTDHVTDPKTLQSPFLYFLYTRYLKNDECNNTMEILPQPDRIHLIQPNVLFIWICFYLGLSAIWLILSITLITTFVTKLKYLLKTIVFLWILSAIEMCTMDFILTVLFGLDFQQIQKHYKADYKFEAEIASITMMIIFSRGFILWIVNFILMTLLFYCIMKMPKKSDRTNIVRRSTDDDNGTIFSSTFGKSSFDNHWQPPIDAFTYSNNNLNPPFQSPPQRMREYQGSHPGWTLRRDGPKHKTNSNHENSSSSDSPVEIPSPDYTPVLPRARKTTQVQKLDRTAF